MSVALYRKYRPKTFEEMVGQRAIKTTLQNEIESSQVAHAYLFSGPRGCGKTTAARLFAKAINCKNRKDNASEPCNACESCNEINEGSAMDLIEIDAASHTGVDNVRENIIQTTQFTPVKNTYKVFIIDEVHMLSTSAFNALLKTLEEPPQYVVFILATTELHKLPQTIISRCQRFDFRKVAVENLVSRLADISKQEKVSVEKQVLEIIAAHSDGCVRDAETLLGQVLALGGKKISLKDAQLILPYSDFALAIEFISFLKECQAAKAIDFINRLVEQGVDLINFAKDVLGVLRKLLLIKSGSVHSSLEVELTSDQEKSLTKIANDVQMSEIVLFITTLMQKIDEMKTASIVQLPLEVGVIEICSRKDDNVIPDADPESKEKILDQAQDDNKRAISEKSALKKEKVVELDNVMPDADPESKVEVVKTKVLTVTLDYVRERWDDCLQRIKEYNHTLFSFLRLNKPVAIKEDIIQIGVSFDFHRERITEVENKKKLEDIFSDILGEKVRIECVKIERKEAAEPENQIDIDLQNLAEAFGGRVLD